MNAINSILAVLGMDINVLAWNWMFTRATLPTVQFILALAVVSMLIGLSLRRRDKLATVTKDVAGNIAQASFGVKFSTERVVPTATVSKSIARDITGISADVGSIRRCGQLAKTSAVELSKLAEHIKATVEQFKA
jgi:hypothetical protein